MDIKRSIKTTFYMVNYNITPLAMREENAKIEKGTSKRVLRKKPYILMEKGFQRACFFFLAGKVGAHV
jgi:hypothetical protein